MIDNKILKALNWAGWTIEYHRLGEKCFLEIRRNDIISIPEDLNEYIMELVEKHTKFNEVKAKINDQVKRWEGNQSKRKKIINIEDVPNEGYTICYLLSLE